MPENEGEHHFPGTEWKLWLQIEEVNDDAATYEDYGMPDPVGTFESLELAQRQVIQILAEYNPETIKNSDHYKPSSPEQELRTLRGCRDEVWYASFLCGLLRQFGHDVEECEQYKDCPERISANEFVFHTVSHQEGNDIPEHFRVMVEPVSPQAVPETAERSLWSEDPGWPVDDWQYEVANGDTRLGYWDWVASQREAGQA